MTIPLNLPQTVIIAAKDIDNTVFKYEQHGYLIQKMKPLEKDVNIYVLQFFRLNKG